MVMACAVPMYSARTRAFASSFAKYVKYLWRKSTSLLATNTLKKGKQPRRLHRSQLRSKRNPQAQAKKEQSASYRAQRRPRVALLATPLAPLPAHLLVKRPRVDTGESRRKRGGSAVVPREKHRARQQSQIKKREILPLQKLRRRHEGENGLVFSMEGLSTVSWAK